MLHKSPLGSLLGLILFLALPAIAQNSPPKPNDPEMDRVQTMIAQAKKEVEEFTKAGGKADDAKHPNVKWAASFWQYRLKHPGTPASTLATTQTLILLNRSDRVSEMQAKADTLKLDDPAWEQVINAVFFASIKTKDYSYLFTNSSKGMSWPQVLDADETLRKLFNVKGTPTYYLIDRDGKIAAKNLPSFKKLNAAIDDLLKKP